MFGKKNQNCDLDRMATMALNSNPRSECNYIGLSLLAEDEDEEVARGLFLRYWNEGRWVGSG